MGNKNYNNHEEEMIKTTKKNMAIKYKEDKNKYKCQFHYSLLKNDCINSIDIIDDKIIIGTIMGDVSLLRVDKNNLIVKNKEKTIVTYDNNQEDNSSRNQENNNININSDIHNSKTDNNKDENGIKCIELKNTNPQIYLDNTNANPSETIENKKFHIKKFVNIKRNKDRKYNNESQTFEKTNDKTKEKTSNKIIKLIKLNSNKNKVINYNKCNDISKKSVRVKEKKEKSLNIKKIKIKEKIKEEKKDNLNIRYDNTNIDNKKDDDSEEDEEEEENESYNNNNDKKSSNKNVISSEIKRFPQITNLIIKSNENIPCLEFDTDDKINISIGDFEVLCMENMATFNMSDKDSSYNYLKIKNYKNDSQHLKYCEHCTCMMNSSNYLIIYTQLAEFNSVLKFSSFKYKNRSLKTYKMVSGRIEMSNYSIPFDFDGDRFLFLDYHSKETRKICIFYTLSDKEMYEYKISKDYGHISHMKIIYNEENKIFLCRNSNQCEIHLIDDNFTCIESWKHIGNDTISSFVYIRGSKLSDEFKKKIREKQNKNLNDEIQEYDKYIMKNNNKAIKFKKNINKLKKNRRNIKLDIIQGASTLLNINNLSSSNNIKNNVDYLNMGYNHTENIGKFINNHKLEPTFNNPDNTSKRELNNSDRLQKNKNDKADGIEIYNVKKLSKNILNDNMDGILDDDKKVDVEITVKDYKNNNTIMENESYNKNTINNYYILTLDKNGNINMYKDHKVKKIFNLYEIEDIDEKYKTSEFFSVGFPYYIIMNELYIAITTDHGLFVISNKNE